MKISINKSQKKQLQEAIESGIFDTEIFPELNPVSDEEILSHLNIDRHSEFFENTKY